MKRFLYIACLVGALAACHWHCAADTALAHDTTPPPAATTYVGVVNHLGWFATMAESIAIPTAQALCDNTHSWHTPTGHHAPAKHTVAQQRQQQQQFVLHLTAATDAVAAHHYVYALRRILR